ncbi:Z1 domain-containing protein [Bacteroides thetaiotaomicron]|nr:Z1 domain-containing protein [Bacteroides thetaiotaomicron]
MTFVNHRCTGGFTYFALHFIHATFCIEPRTRGAQKNDPKPTFADIPESLKTAIKSFILTCAIRLARGQENKHNSMLIHVSRYQLWQNEIKELVAQQFSYYKQEIEANDPSVLSEFQDLLENDYTETTNKIKNSTLSNIDHCLQVHQWEDIKPFTFQSCSEN